MEKQAIDLGTLQSKLSNARKLHKSNSRLLANAQERYDSSRKALENAEQTLKSAARSVISGGEA